MTLEEFRSDFIADVKASATATGDGSCASFVDEAAGYLEDNDLMPDHTACYFTGEYRRKRFRIDGFAYDDMDCTMYLITADYTGTDDERTIQRATANQIISRAMLFVEAALHPSSSTFESVDISMPVNDLIDLIRSEYKNIREFRVIIFTDAVMSSRIRSLETEDFYGIPVDGQIWDLGRIFEVCTNTDTESIEINFSDFGCKGIPCIEANVGEGQKYKSYLGVIPGTLLADIYDKYGGRLLEGNVRAFLSTKVAVNKQIRNTILTRPEMFFAFNNGISVTAKDVKIEKLSGSNYITSARDFQIINGGQTTASLYNARKTNNADLSKIFVQMKLTEIDEENTKVEEADQLIRDISKSSNSQNKVSDADFFAAHPFHRQIEQISKSVLAPAAHGAQFSTRWYYERARGQYLQEQMRLTPSGRKAFLLKCPKDQVVKKTDLAKVQNTWLGHPDTVSKGAQTNFLKFADDYVKDQWEKNSNQFNEKYYKDTISLIIMFNYLTQSVSKQPWYQGGYRANIVVYTIALFHQLIKKQFPGRDLDLSTVWNRQEVPDPIKKSLNVIAEKVFYQITDEKRPVMNVTQWCKRSACWDGVLTLQIDLPDELGNYLISIGELKEAAKKSSRSQRVDSGINAQKEVVALPVSYWKELTAFSVKYGIAKSPSDATALKMACGMPGLIPNAVESQRLLRIKKNAEDAGFHRI